MQQQIKELVTHLRQYSMDAFDGRSIGGQPIPTDVWLLVLEFLSFREIYDVSWVNKHFRNAVVPKLLTKIGPALAQSLEDYPLTSYPRFVNPRYWDRVHALRRRLLQPSTSILLRMDALINVTTQGLDATHALIIKKLILNQQGTAELIDPYTQHFAADPATVNELWVPIVDARRIPVVIIAASLGRTEVLRQLLPQNVNAGLGNVLLTSRRVGQQALIRACQNGHADTLTLLRNYITQQHRGLFCREINNFQDFQNFKNWQLNLLQTATFQLDLTTIEYTYSRQDRDSVSLNFTHLTLAGAKRQIGLLPEENYAANRAAIIAKTQQVLALHSQKQIETGVRVKTYYGGDARYFPCRPFALCLLFDLHEFIDQFFPTVYYHKSRISHRYLLPASISIDVKAGSSLEFAILTKHWAIVKRLLKLSPEPTLPIYLEATRNGQFIPDYPARAKALLSQYKAALRQAASTGRALNGLSEIPIQLYALFTENLPLLKCLIESGYNMSVSDRNGNTLMEWARKINHRDALQLLTPLVPSIRSFTLFNTPKAVTKVLVQTSNRLDKHWNHKHCHNLLSRTMHVIRKGYLEHGTKKTKTKSNRIAAKTLVETLQKQRVQFNDAAKLYRHLRMILGKLEKDSGGLARCLKYCLAKVEPQVHQQIDQQRYKFNA